jgi:CheY-like chemotaxis protein
MDEQRNPWVICIVEEDDDDRVLLAEALKTNGLEKGVQFLADIHELIDFCNTRAQYSIPALILLNAFMRMMNIRHAIALIRSVEELRMVPLVVMLGSPAEQEYLQSFDLKVVGYAIKPVNAQIIKQFLEIS